MKEEEVKIKKVQKYHFLKDDTSENILRNYGISISPRCYHQLLYIIYPHIVND